MSLLIEVFVLQEGQGFPIDRDLHDVVFDVADDLACRKDDQPQQSPELLF